MKAENAKTNRTQGCREKANIKNAKTNPSTLLPPQLSHTGETAALGEENRPRFCQNELPSIAGLHQGQEWE